MTCKHEDFQANVIVNRLQDTSSFSADIRINCRKCGLPFEFLGLKPGLDTQGACVSIDGQEARIAIVPRGVRPNPLQRMAFGIQSSN